jgi:hypothetical protein
VRLTVFSIIMRLTISSLLWGLSFLLYYEAYPLFHYYEPYAIFVIMRLTLSSVIMSLTLSSLLRGLPSLPLLCVHASYFTIQTLYFYSLQIMLSSNTINQSTWNFIILLCIIKSQLQHTFRYFKSIQNLSFMHHFITSLIF